MEWFETMTVEKVLERMENTEFCAAVRLNNRIVSSPNFSRTLVPDRSIIQILPLIAGG
ncbi:MAG: thiamine biosynthesis protein ThiS [Desulfobacterium sp.]|nr:thiamine biosynthesis protein ThiS [Desulfobacterium sp.]